MRCKPNPKDLSREATFLINKKAVLPQGNRAMLQVFFSVEYANNIPYKYKTSRASKATLQSSKHAGENTI